MTEQKMHLKNFENKSVFRLNTMVNIKTIINLTANRNDFYYWDLSMLSIMKEYA